MKLPWKKVKEERAESDNTENLAELIRALLGSEEITKEKALEIPAVASSVAMIASSVAAVDFKLYKVEDGVPKLQQDDRRVKLLNDDTGDTLDSIQFWSAIVGDYYLDKGGYAFINKNFNRIESLHYVDATRISFLHNNDPIFKEYRILCNAKKYYPFEFIKILRNTKNGWKGRSILEENPLLMQVAYSELKFEESQTSKGGNKKGFLLAERKLEKEAMDSLKEAFRNLYSNNSENVVVLNNGIKFQESSNTSVELQLQEMKEANTKEIYKLFQIPPPIMEGGATEEDKRRFYEGSIKSVLDAIKSQLNREMLLEKEKNDMYFDYDMSSLLKGDVKSRYETYKTALDAGFLSVDEVRRKENEQPIGLPFVKLNLADVLYDPKSKTVYAINTDKSMSIEDLKKGGNKIDES